MPSPARRSNPSHPGVPAEPPVVQVAPAKVPDGGEVCSNCRHFDRQDDEVGKCRRFPPNIMDPTNLHVSGPLCRFPLVLHSDTCGEFSGSAR